MLLGVGTLLKQDSGKATDSSFPRELLCDQIPMNMVPAVLLAIGLSANAEGSCPHDFALYCPAPEAPRVTELREGSVRLIYTVKLTGSVRNIVVAEHTGDARWQASVIETVAKWRYTPPKEVYEQSYFFTAEFAE